MNQKKVLVIGDTSVGKTSILIRYVNNEFDEESMPTLGSSFKTKEVEFKTANGQKDKTKISIWDTAGQERFDSLTKMYFRGASAALICYDVTNELSFAKVKKWVGDLKEHEESDNSRILKFIVGNKSDLSSQKEVAT